MKKIAISLLFFLLVFCVAIEAEKELPQDIKDWYELHQILMEAKVPEIKENWTEADVFLAIHPEMQRTYRMLFWDLRKPGLDKLFYDNLVYANDEFIFTEIRKIPNWKEKFAPNISGWRFIRSWAVGWIRNWGPKKKK